MKREIVAANAIVREDEYGYIPVRIMTMTPEPRKLYKGTRLGLVEPVGQPAQVRSIGIGEDTSTKTKSVLELFRRQLQEMPPDHARLMSSILNEFADVFSTSRMDIGCTREVEHKILTGNSPPVMLNPRRVPLALEKKGDELIDKLVEQGVIRPSHSPWNAPIVVVQKKNGDIRMCVDYRKLNAVTLRPVFPIPDAVQLFDTLEGATFFSSLDLSQGYYQVPMAEEDIQKTAFATRKGQFEFLRMPFGLCSAPATFQRLMHTVLRNENWRRCIIYLDDILVFGRTLEEHCDRLRTVLQSFRAASLKLSPEKC